MYQTGELISALGYYTFCYFMVLLLFNDNHSHTHTDPLTLIISYLFSISG